MSNDNRLGIFKFDKCVAQVKEICSGKGGLV